MPNITSEQITQVKEALCKARAAFAGIQGCFGLVLQVSKDPVISLDSAYFILDAIENNGEKTCETCGLRYKCLSSPKSSSYHCQAYIPKKETSK